jgi:hypothetical protein
MMVLVSTQVLRLMVSAYEFSHVFILTSVDGYLLFTLLRLVRLF